MDAKQLVIPVTIAGRPIDLIAPTQDQLWGMSLLANDQLPDGARMNAVNAMMMALLPDDEAKTHFAEQLVTGGYTIEDMMVTLKAVATVEPVTREKAAQMRADVEAGVPVKAHPRKTAAKRVARKPRA